MRLTLFALVLTLAPAVFAVAAAALGQIKPAPPRYALFAVAALGALVPAISLLIIVPELSSGVPVRLALFGGVTSPSAVFSPLYRLDALGLYAGVGLAFVVTPLLLWLAWQGALREDSDSTSATAAAAPSWAGIALALGVESAALTVLFADNLLWLGLSWIVLAALAWGLGEVGSDGGTLDRLGLALMLLGPVLWLIVAALPASTAKSWSLYDLQGRGSFSTFHVILLAVVLAMAGGAYPFTAWVRRRAALTTPAGLGAVVLVVLPLTLFVGARTFAAAQDPNGLWPQIGKATPPITAGVALALLGSITLALTGLLALARRDVRAALAYLAVAQVGWGLLALGVGEPSSLLAVVVLLATSIFGLGAMLAAVYAGGTLTGDIEPDGAGPHAFGARLQPVSLFAWSLGAVTLVGAPLFGGFVPRQMTSGAALQSGGLLIPLTGLAWAGDALLALALLRLTAPAFAAVFAKPAVQSAAMSAPAAVDAAVEEDAVDEDDEDDDTDDTYETIESAVTEPRAGRIQAMRDPRELPALALALLALVIGVAPQLLLNFGGKLATTELLQAGALDRALDVKTFGYVVTAGQWLPTLAWLAIAGVAVLLLILVPGARTVKPLLVPTAPGATSEAEAAPELAGLPDPADAWSDLGAAFASQWVVPAGDWLLAGTDEGEDDELADEDELTDEDELAADNQVEVEEGSELAAEEEDAASVAGEEDADETVDTPSVQEASAEADGKAPENGANAGEATGGAATNTRDAPRPRARVAKRGTGAGRRGKDAGDEA